MPRIGGFTLESIVEIEAPFMAPFDFFPDAHEEVFARHAHWLKPRYQDTASGHLIFCFQSFVLRMPHHTILVDSCIGNDKHRPSRPGWHLRKGSFLGDLAGIGVRPDEVDFVLCTHLHADHVGWNTRLDDGHCANWGQSRISDDLPRLISL